MSNGQEIMMALLECLGVFVGLAGCILIHIDHKQPTPYMDEIFHIPQVKKYCAGNFIEWDPMITTLPGLYISSLNILQPVSWLFGIDISVACSTFWLRSINIIFAAGNVIVILLLLKKIHNQDTKNDETKILMTAMTLGIFPVLYFFTFLYYTDPGSTFFCLVTYLLSMHQFHFLSSMCGIVAVLFRQTNIVWVVFAAGITASDIVMDHLELTKKEIKQDITKISFLQYILTYLWNSLKSNRKSLVILFSKLISQLWSYIMVGILFCLFVFVNDGIVVGAKSDHQACLHFPQILYFITFTAIFSFAHISFKEIFRFPKDVFKRPVVYFIIGVISLFAVFKFTYAHRYLLADNRHYTFYVWHKIFLRHPYIKYSLIPGYLGAGYLVSNWLKHKHILWKIVFLICIFTQTVPQMLLEFRYFILPYLVIRINMQMSSYYRLALEMVFYIIINGATLYMFTEKPFIWNNDGSLQRFMW